MAYTGPLRDEPIAIELHNTIYATSEGAVDGLASPESARAWIEAVVRRLPVGQLPPGSWPSAAELVALRDAVRPALQAAAAGSPPERSAVDAINAASRRAPRAAIAVWRKGELPSPGADFAGASRADIVLAAIAADAIELLTGRFELRTCGAPRCVLMFLKDHPRREWCSERCGNRARQARHYERHGGRR